MVLVASERSESHLVSTQLEVLIIFYTLLMVLDFGCSGSDFCFNQNQNLKLGTGENPTRLIIQSLVYTLRFAQDAALILWYVFFLICPL